jgi:hypothetical protein
LSTDRVYLLGAGFSKAVSATMPTMDQLSKNVQNYLGSEENPRKIPGADTPLVNDFEQWLSYLVESPPWLSRADKALNQWAFIKVTDAVHEVLKVKQLHAVETDSCPPWLQQLVRYWQEQSSTRVHDRGVLKVGAGGDRGMHLLAFAVAPDRGPCCEEHTVGGAGGDEDRPGGGHEPTARRACRLIR